MEEEKKEVGTQAKLENEKTGHLVRKRMRRESQGVLGSWL